MSKPTPIKPPTILADRQREVLIYIASGETRKSIALILKISEKTVEYHAMRLMNILNIYSVALLTQYAIVTKLIEPLYDARVVEEIKPVKKATGNWWHSLHSKGSEKNALRKYAEVYGV